MTQNRKTSNWTRALVLLLAMVLTGCSTYRSVSLADAPELLDPGDTVRFSTLEGDDFKLKIDWIAAASFSAESREFRFEDIARLERREFDLLKSVGLYLGINVVFLLITGGPSYDFGNLGS